MKLIEKLTKEKYEKFCSEHKDSSHFLHSYLWGEFQQKERNVIPHYIGYEDDKKNLVAVALLLERSLMLGYTYFYSPRGFIIDYKNKELLKSFTNDLKDFAKKRKALFIKIDPDFKLHDLDIEGNILEENNNEEVVSYLKSLGYKHMGFNKNFENNQPRYTFRLSLEPTIEEITKNFHPTTKKIINKGNPYNLELIKNDKKTIDDFFETMSQTSDREGIVNHSFKYYKEYYETLHKENMSDLYVVKVDINNLKKTYKEKINNLEANIEKMSDEKYKDSEKNANKKQEFINQLTKAKKEFEVIEPIKDDKLTLSAILTAKYGNKVWTLHGGNNTLLRELNGNYFIYYEIIKDAKEEGYEIIDFFGTTGDPSKENPVYGIHLFKKRLGGEYTEFIGEFDLIINKPIYYIYKTLVPIRYKLQKLRYNNKK
ncbi:MAG: peptidoglycan bridge formation glycyltransferase FemA/FemB family protein [Bacilli bacterium]|nr:peptidoglycan bridge formation glycyltransferase FemA/FemB family protein [Bacilli bacterium]